jgi:hypothetical protein
MQKMRVDMVGKPTTTSKILWKRICRILDLKVLKRVEFWVIFVIENWKLKIQIQSDEWCIKFTLVQATHPGINLKESGFAMYLTLRSVSSWNNPENSEMKFCEKHEVNMLKIIIIIIGLHSE